MIERDVICAAFARNLRHFLRDFEISQAELSRLSGLKENTISVLTTGRVEPNLVTVVKILTALGLSLEDMLQ